MSSYFVHLPLYRRLIMYVSAETRVKEFLKLTKRCHQLRSKATSSSKPAVDRKRARSQMDRNQKELRRLLKQQDVKNNLKQALANVGPSVRRASFKDVEYPGTTTPGDKKDVTIPLPAFHSYKFVESCWYSWWEKNGHFSPEKMPRQSHAPSNKKKTFSMVIPPPNVTGRLHIGHALTAALEDTLARRQRMLGNDVLWLPGCDHAGIATQLVVEQSIERKYGHSRHQLGREKFKEAIWDWKRGKADDIYQQLRRLGSTLDWDRSVFTLDKNYSYAVQEAFIRLHKEGIIYRDECCVNWSCRLLSTLSDLEVESKVLDEPMSIPIPGYNKPVLFGMMHNFAYKLKHPVGDVDEIVVGTTRVETMVGDEAVAVHPDDPRYSALVGHWLVHPILYGKLIPVIADDAVDMDMGTGALKVTPAHDFTDFEIGQRHNLPIRSCISEDGMINYNEGHSGIMTSVKSRHFYINNRPRFQARDNIIFHLMKKNLFRGSHPHPTVLRLCARSGDIIEPMVRQQWFVRVPEMAKEAIEAVESGKINFVQSSTYKNQWNQWLTTTGDWCISRQTWWGHQIPAYHCTNTKTGESTWISARKKSDALKDATEKLSASSRRDISIKQDSDVLDTWFSSALFPFASFGWPNETDDLRKFYPLTLMETGSDLIFFWVARMVMLGIKLTGEVPFKNVLFHPLIRDEHNRKMSKSVGNVIDPLEVIDGTTMQDHAKNLEESGLSGENVALAVKDFYKTSKGNIPPCGSDALKLSLCSLSTEVQNLKYNLVNTFTWKKFCNKVWNTFLFVESCTSHPGSYKQMQARKQDKNQLQDQLNPVDLWIKSRLANTVEECNRNLEQFNVSQALRCLGQFLTDLSNIYVEYCKNVLRKRSPERDDGEKFPALLFDLSSDRTIAVALNLLGIMEAFLRLLCPFAPFLCEELWQRIPHELLDSETAESVCLAPYPTLEQFGKDQNVTIDEEVGLVMSQIHKIRKEKTLHSLPANYGAVLVCKNEKDEDVLSRLSDAIHSLLPCNSVEIFSHDKIDEVREQWLGSYDQAADITVLFRYEPDVIRKYIEERLSVYLLAREKWIQKVEQFEKIAANLKNRNSACDNIIKVSEDYLKKQRMLDSIEKVQKHLEMS